MNAKNLHNACCQPFEEITEKQISQTDMAKQQLMRLIGLKVYKQAMAQDLDQHSIDFDAVSLEQNPKLLTVPQAKEIKRNGKQSVRIDRSKSRLVEKNGHSAKSKNEPMQTPNVKKLVEKSPSTVSSYVGGFLVPQNVRNTVGRDSTLKQVDQLNSDVKKLDP